MDLRALLLPEPSAAPAARARVECRREDRAPRGDRRARGRAFFGAEADALLPWLYAAMASGAVMLAVELYSSLDYLTELGGLAVVLKLALLCAIPFAWSARVPLPVRRRGRRRHRLSHVGEYRHYSLRHHRVMKD